MVRKIKTETDTVSGEKKNTGMNMFRPDDMDCYTGQKQAKKAIEIAVNSARARNCPLPHILLYGPPGLGKTSLAVLCAKQMGVPLVMAAGPGIEKPGDIAGILNSLQSGSVLFIDEIHRMNRQAEEFLYSAMEDGFITITVGQAEQSKTIKLSLPPFTLIGATTRAGMLSAPLRDRFILCCRMEYYSTDELCRIEERSCAKLGIFMTVRQRMRVAMASRGTPRLANRFLVSIRDYAYSENGGIVDDAVVDGALSLAGVNPDGLTETDMKILDILSDAPRPVGLSTLSHVLGEDPQTVEEVYEPYLIMKQYIIKTPRGREITEAGSFIAMKNRLRLSQEGQNTDKNTGRF